MRSSPVREEDVWSSAAPLPNGAHSVSECPRPFDRPFVRHGSEAENEEEVVYARLPADIAGRWVLLLDPVLGTGHTACRAVQVRGGV